MKHLSRRAAALSLALSSALFVGPVVATSAQASPAAVAGSTHAPHGNPDFSGIVALSNCSGSIVRWKSSKQQDKALMLTNGHCTRLYGAHDVDVDKPLVRSVRLL